MISSSKLERCMSSMSLEELAKESISAIPNRYIRVDQEPSISLNESYTPSIPTIDMARLVVGETKDFELQKLHSTCKEWGIFQLINHGVSSSLLEKLKNEIDEFYKLPLEERMRYKIKPGDFEGYGQTILHSEDQKVDWAYRLYMITNPIHRRKPHLFPQLPSSLRELLEAYFSELQQIAMTLLGLMSDALNIDKREVEEMFENCMQSVRMTYYPPCPQPELVMGISPHSDGTAITILLQVNGVEGLEVKKGGVWVPVKFLPDSFIVHVGDILEILSNGIYNSIEHKVTVNSVKERISLAMFFNPNFEAEVGPARNLINQENPPLFKRVHMEKYVKGFFSRKLDSKSYLDQMRIEQGKARTK